MVRAIERSFHCCDAASFARVAKARKRRARPYGKGSHADRDSYTIEWDLRRVAGHLAKAEQYRKFGDCEKLTDADCEDLRRRRKAAFDYFCERFTHHLATLQTAALTPQPRTPPPCPCPPPHPPSSPPPAET